MTAPAGTAVAIPGEGVGTESPRATAPTRPFREGATAVLPILPAVVPFGLVAGVAAVAAGFSKLMAVLASLIVFAGASQLAMYDLLGQGAPWLLAAAAVLCVNLRFTLYSASLAPHFADVGARKRIGLAYLLTDQAYAVSILRFTRAESDGFARGLDARARCLYYLGAALPLWVTWQLSATAGVLLGANLPPTSGSTSRFRSCSSRSSCRR